MSLKLPPIPNAMFKAKTEAYHRSAEAIPAPQW